jgi:hypothetical protein
MLLEWIKTSLPEPADVTLSLLCHSSEHGFGAAAFHSLCDNKGATVTLIKSTNGSVFGGYSDKSWKSDYTRVHSNNAFLFSFVNPSGSEPIKMALTGVRNEGAICCYPNCGPVFGSGCDLLISDNCDMNTNSYSELGTTYSVPAGQNSETFLTGAKRFTVSAIEVFAVFQ